MTLLDFILFGISLSMDAFAISMVKGLLMKKMDWGQACVIGLFFGGFQFLMPLCGWLLGSRFQDYIAAIDHWVAFGLLSFIGGKMIWESLHADKEDRKLEHEKLDLKELLLLAVATSIDALAVGITFAFLEVPVLYASAVIGIVTFAICVGGVAIGHVFGTRFQKGAQVLGGAVLILMGLRILLRDLGVIAF